MRVLFAEDFEVLAHAIATGPRREGMAADVVPGGDVTLESAAVTRLRLKLGDPPVNQTVREGGYRIGDRTPGVSIRGRFVRDVSRRRPHEPAASHSPGG